MKDKKETVNIALIDLNHMTMGVHTNTAPLGLGSIAYYLTNNINHKFDIRMFKDPHKFLHILGKWKPDVLGITQYAWNSELNFYMARLVKKDNPECLIVAGGPNLYLSSEQKAAYLKKYDFIDVCVNYDGEIPFTEIVKRFINGEKIKDIRRLPCAGTYSVDTVSGKLVESKEPAPRLTSLDVFRSIYAEGFFDKLLDEGFHPFLQTQRGCPYKCTYCHTGNDYSSRMIFQSVEYFKRNMEYLGKRFAGQHNVILYMANTNFGLFKEDFEIARAIREIQDKYDWPKNIDVNTTVNPDRIFDLLSILKYKFPSAISLQTLDPKVLTNIKRKNIPFEKFVAFQKRITENIGERTETELILSLPGETKESFLDGITRILNSGVQNIIIYTLMSLKGTPMSSHETIKRYGHVIRHRIVPRCFSEINGVKIFDTEEVVVGTKSMPFEDYIDLRKLALIITVFASSIEMFPIRKFIMQHGLDVASWIYGIQNEISNFPNLHNAYKYFLQETKKELFVSRDELIDFFNKQENYDLLCEGKLGDNLLRKYKAIILSRHYKECLQIAFSELRRLAKQRFDLKTLDPLINDLELYLKSRNIGHIFKEEYDQIMLKDVVLHYDVVKWLEQGEGGASLEEYKGRFPYSIVITDYMRNRLRGFVEMNREPEFSMQILYRDGYIKDFWPLWVSNNQKKECKIAEGSA